MGEVPNLTYKAGESRISSHTPSDLTEGLREGCLLLGAFVDVRRCHQSINDAVHQSSIHKKHNSIHENDRQSTRRGGGLRRLGGGLKRLRGGLKRKMVDFVYLAPSTLSFHQKTIPLGRKPPGLCPLNPRSVPTKSATTTKIDLQNQLENKLPTKSPTPNHPIIYNRGAPPGI